MSAYTHITQDLIADALGESAQLHFLRPGSRCVAYVEHNREVLAIAAGADHGEACKALIQMLTRGDLTLTTEEAARVLGIDASSLRHRAQRGSIAVAVPSTTPRMSSRYEPAEVWRVLEGDSDIKMLLKLQAAPVDP